MPESYSRTKKSMRNSVVALTIQFLAMLAGFFSRKIFIDCLGTEVLGLNTTATSILSGLNLLELGIWSAISVTLYKPLFQGDKQAVKEIVALHGRLYKLVAYAVIAGSLVVMCFFPQIFSKSPLPLWYPYATFGVLLYSAMLTYFVTYRRSVLYADQQNYKVLLSTRLVSLVKLICQAVAVYHSGNGFIWWLALEAGFATMGAVIVQIVVYKSFPYLREKVENPRTLKNKYPEVLQKIKYLAFHKLGAFGISQLSPVIIYGFASLTLVALYGNYMILVVNIYSILGALYAGMEASIGNMVAEGDRKLTMRVFGELFSMRILICSVATVGLWLLSGPLIEVWLGPQYVMGKSTLLLIVIGFFVGSSRGIVQSYVDAHGAFSDIGAPVAEFVLCVGLSIGGGALWGLDGILAGNLAAQLIIGHLWKPYFLFVKVMKEPLTDYVKMFAKHLLLMGSGAAAVIFLFRYMPIDPASSILSFLAAALIVLIVCVIVMGGLTFAFSSGARNFARRIFSALRTARS